MNKTHPIFYYTPLPKYSPLYPTRINPYPLNAYTLVEIWSFTTTIVENNLSKKSTFFVKTSCFWTISGLTCPKKLVFAKRSCLCMARVVCDRLQKTKFLQVIVLSKFKEFQRCIIKYN